MSIWQKAVNQTAYLKAGFLGFEGSGKTRTAFELMAALCMHMFKISKDKRHLKLGFFDTEKGSDFFVDPQGNLRPEYAKRFPGLELVVVKSKSFVDLLSALREAEKEGFGGVMMDSVTHVWKDLMDSWLRKQGRSFLEISDWGKLKGEWAQFTTLFINSSLHLAMLGRAGDDYDNYLDENGKEKMVKAGTKMKVEKETGFEPDLLCEMFKESQLVNTAKGGGNKKKMKAQGFVNRCIVLKDRNSAINGQVFTFTGEGAVNVFQAFKPVIDLLAIGTAHVGVDPSRTSDSLFEGDGRDGSWYAMKQLCQVRLEEIKEAFILDNLSGASNDAIKIRVELLIGAFGTSAWTAIEAMKLTELDGGLAKLRAAITALRMAAASAPAAPAAKLKPVPAPAAPAVAPVQEAGKEAAPALPGIAA